LSGGEQQRVALGRALYSKPTILLLDEPLSALDWNLRKHVREDLVSIIREWDVPCVWVTHDESEAEMVGDRHWTCEEGQIQISK
jgi:ABC transporter related protein